MSAHTPGPWKAEQGGRITSANGWLLASAWHTEYVVPDANEDRLPGESWLDARKRIRPDVDRIEAAIEANARLMASAPDLLAALIGLCAAASKTDPQHWRDARADASAAIAKATGEKA